jgi:hypothetical protein
MKALYRFTLDWGRMGTLTSLFVAEQEQVQALIGKEVYFGEVLGKHSEVCDEVTAKMLEMVSDSQELVSLFEFYHCETGPNPLKHVYMRENEDE